MFFSLNDSLDFPIDISRLFRPSAAAIAAVSWLSRPPPLRCYTFKNTYILKPRETSLVVVDDFENELQTEISLFFSLGKIFHSQGAGAASDSSSPISTSDAGATESNNHEEAGEGGDEAEEEESDGGKKVSWVKMRLSGKFETFLTAIIKHVLDSTMNETWRIVNEQTQQRRS